MEFVHENQMDPFPLDFLSMNMAIGSAGQRYSHISDSCLYALIYIVYALNLSCVSAANDRLGQ